MPENAVNTVTDNEPNTDSADTPATIPAAPIRRPPPAHYMPPGVPSSPAAQLHWAENICKSPLLPDQLRSVAGVLTIIQLAIWMETPFWEVVHNGHFLPGGRLTWDATYSRTRVRTRGWHRIRI